MPADERLLCLACGQWFDHIKDVACCPGCGDHGIPASSKDLVTVSITWHELRCLVMWAERFAHITDKKGDNPRRLLPVVYGIADRLYQQHLSNSPLTLAGEIADVKAALGESNVDTKNIPGHPDFDAEP